MRKRHLPKATERKVSFSFFIVDFEKLNLLLDIIKSFLELNTLRNFYHLHNNNKKA